MKVKIIKLALCIACPVLLICSGKTAYGAGLPDNVGASLQQHETEMNRTGFTWKLQSEEKRAAWPTSKMQTITEDLKRSWAAEYQRNGVTNKRQVQKLVQENMTSFLQSVKQTSVNYSSTWQLERDGQTVLAAGEVQHQSGYYSVYRQFYSGRAALVVNDKVVSVSDARVEPQPTLVWGTMHESFRDFSPVTSGLNILPEHFVMLMGMNPLALHGANWKLVATTPYTWNLEAQVEYSGVPTQIKLVLDRKHGNLPLKIQIAENTETRTFQAEHFHRYKSGWVCDEVRYQDNNPGTASADQKWELKDIRLPQSIAISLAAKQRVIDCRLMNEVTTWQDIEKAGSHNSGVIYYVWPGHFPPLDELKKMQHKQNPGEATPDVGQSGVSNPSSAASMASSFLPFAGGVLCLAGGVWMFKQRKAN